jgi:hypothetical protein
MSCGFRHLDPLRHPARRHRCRRGPGLRDTVLPRSRDVPGRLRRRAQAASCPPPRRLPGSVHGARNAGPTGREGAPPGRLGRSPSASRGPGGGRDVPGPPFPDGRSPAARAGPLSGALPTGRFHRPSRGFGSHPGTVNCPRGRAERLIHRDRTDQRTQEQRNLTVRRHTHPPSRGSLSAWRRDPHALRVATRGSKQSTPSLRPTRRAAKASRAPGHTLATAYYQRTPAT